MKKKNIFYILTILLCMMIYSPVFAREYKADDDGNSEYVVPDGAYIIGTQMFAYPDGIHSEYEYNEFFDGGILTAQVMLGSSSIVTSDITSLDELIIYNKIFDEFWINTDTGADMTDYPDTFEILYINGVCIEDSCQTGAQGYRNVTFNYWDANKQNKTKTVSVRLGEKIAAADVPALEDVPGYRFQIWKNGDQEFSLNTAISDNITLTANYLPITYSIKYVIGDDATFEGHDLSKTYYCSVTGINTQDCIALGSSRDIPKRSGYTFLGWSMNPSGDELFAAGDSLESILTADTSITLYAVWAIKDYAIEYDLAGGKFNSLTVIYSYNMNNPTISVPVPTRVGYTFGGWSTTNTNISIDNTRNKFTVNTPSNVVLTATWEARTYNIKYNNTTIADTPCTYGSICTITDSIPTSANKDFMYWEYNGYAYYPGGAFTFYAGTTFNTSVTLTPHFNSGTDYSINYNLNNGYFDGAVVTEYTYGVGTTLPTPVRRGYEFEGWTLNNTPIDRITTHQSGNVTVVATWSKLTYSLQYADGIHNSVTCQYDSTCVAGAAPTSTEFSFRYWVDDHGHYYNPGDSIIPVFNDDEDELLPVTLSPVWNDGNAYSITYDPGEGSLQNAVSSYVYGYGTNLPTPTWEGHRFTGWVDSNNHPVASITANDSGDISLTATWETITHLFAYSSNGNITKNTYDYGTEVTAPADPTDAPSLNATFAGWYDSRTGNRVNSGSHFNLTQDTVLVAKWTFDNVFGIGYDLQGGDFAEAPTIVFAYPTENVVDVQTPTKEGYIFDGWTVEGDASISGNRMTINSGENIYLTAKWKKSIINIKYNFNGGIPGEGTVYTYTYNYNAPINQVPLVQPTREGYEFTRWTLTSASGARILGASIYLTNPVDVELTAEWNRLEYRVIFNVDDREVGHMACTHDELCKITQSDPTPEEGYTFLYWIDENGAIYKEGSKAIFNRDATLTAVFSAGNEYSITYELYGGHFTAAAVPRYQFTPEGGNGTPTPLPGAEIIEKEGYEFEGWCLEENCDDDDMVVSLIGMTGDITLFAKYSAKTYNVTYYQFENGDDIQATDTGISYNDTYTIEGYLGTVPGHIFVCWAADGIYYFPGDTVNHYEENLELRPVFKEASTVTAHLIEYELNGGQQPVNGILAPRYVEGDTFALGTVSREGYTFLGWTLTEEDNGEYITTVSGLTTDVTLYAQWEGMTYSINLYSGDGTLLDQLTSNFGETEVIGLFHDSNTDQDVYAWDIVQGGNTIYYRYDHDFGLETNYNAAYNLFAVDNYDLTPITITYNFARILNEAPTCGADDQELTFYVGETIDFGDAQDCSSTLLNDYTWYTDADYTSDPIDLSEPLTIDDTDMHIYGKYDAGYTTHTVTLIGHRSNGMAVNPVTATVRWGLTIPNLDNIVIYSAGFGSYYYDDFYWYLDESKTEEVKLEDYVITDDITFYGYRQ